MKNKQPFNEQEFIGASYVTTFYEYVGLLTIAVSEYKNLLLEKEQEETSLTEEQKNNIKQAIGIVRKYLTITNIQYETISESIDEEKKKSIKELYEELNKQFTMRKEELEEYAKEMNKILVSKKIKELLKTSQDRLNEIYERTTLQH